MVSSESPEDQLYPSEFDKSRVSVDIWRGGHSFEKDFDTLGPLIRGRQYDIWVPELAGPSNEHRDTFRGIANGDPKAYRHSKTWKGPGMVSHAGLLKSLYGSHLKIFFADYDKPQLEEDEDIPLILGRMPFKDLGDLDSCIAYCLDGARRGAVMIEKRDDNIAHNFDVDLPSFIEQHPKLRDRDKIRVLGSIGYNHLRLPEKIEGVGYETNTIIPRAPMSPTTEVVHKIQKGEELERSLLVQMVLESFLGSVIGHTDGLQRDASIRQITEATPEQDVAALIASYRKYGEEVCRIFTDQAAGRLGIVDPGLTLLVDKPKKDLSFVTKQFKY